MTDPPPATLAVDAIAKAYGETRALVSCSMGLRRGEVHAVIGENGSGKSTLVKILSGVTRPDAGRVMISGASSSGFATPHQARERGLATVFQEILVVPGLSVYDNLYLGADGIVRRNGVAGARRPEASELLRRLLDTDVGLDGPIGPLGLGIKQVCGIVRAILQRPAVLLLDESTSALDVRVRDRLFELVREFSASGGSVMFISHRMDEIEEIADRVTVLRSGRSVATLERSAASPQRLLNLMSGSDGMPEATRTIVSSARDRSHAVILSARGLVVRAGAAPIDLDITAGEIIGLGGLEGHGQHEFIECLAGLLPPLVGSIVLQPNDRSTEVSADRDVRRSDIAYVPRDRKREGIFAPLSALDNFAVPSLEVDARAGVILSTRLIARFRRFADQFGVVARPSTRITALSGGNQQKLLMARWLATSPQILLLNDPTRGVDHATKQDIYRRLREIAQDGIAVVMLSTEVDELLALMDRVLIFRNGSVFATFDNDEVDRHRIVASYFGQPQAA